MAAVFNVTRVASHVVAQTVSVNVTVPTAAFVCRSSLKSEGSILSAPVRSVAPRAFDFADSPSTFMGNLHSGALLLKPEEYRLGVIFEDATYDLVLWNTGYFSQEREYKGVRYNSGTDPEVGDGSTGVSFFSPVDGSPLSLLDVIRGGDWYKGEAFASGTEGESGELTPWTIRYDIGDGNNRIPHSLYVVRGAVVWSIPPNTGEPYGEKFQWTTDIVKFENGREQRAALKDYPSLTIEATYSATRETLQLLNNLVWGWQSRPFKFPLWHKRLLLKEQGNQGWSEVKVRASQQEVDWARIQAGDEVILWLSPTRYQVRQVEMLGTYYGGEDVWVTFDKPLDYDVPANTLLMPLRSGARMEKEVQGTSLTGEVSSWTIRFTMREDEYYPDTADLDSFEGYNVLKVMPNWAESVQEIVTRDVVEVTDNVSLDYTYDRSVAPEVSRSFMYWVSTPSQLDSMMRWFYSRRGSAHPFWLPTGKSDLSIAAEVTEAASTTIEVSYASATTMYSRSRAGREAILIELTDGTKIMRRIADITSPGGGGGSVEMVHFAAPLGKRLFTSRYYDYHLDKWFSPNVRAINFMGMCRLASDEVTLIWSSDKVVATQNNMVSITEV